MAIKPIKRTYSLSDALLAELGDDLVAFAVRDTAEMTTFGYDAAKLAAIEAKITAFKDFPKDDYYTGILMVATSQKNEKIKAMSKTGQEIVQRVVIKWGKNSGQEKSMGFAGYAGMNDAEKVSACRTAYKFANTNKAELAGQGLTDAILDTFKDEITASDDAISAKRQRVGERDTAVTTRVKLGNDLYADLVPLADTGKTIWETTDESKYNDYVIYDNQAGVQTHPGTAPAGSVHAPGVSITADSDEVEISVESGTLIAYCGNEPTDEPLPGQITFTVSVGTPYSGTAAGLGWTSENFRLLLQNEGAADVEFSLVVRG